MVFAAYFFGKVEAVPRKLNVTATPPTSPVHRSYGEVTPLQRVITDSGMPALRVKCPDGQVRTFLLEQQYWATPILHLLNIGSNPPKRTKKREPAPDGRAALENTLPDAEADHAALRAQQEEFEELPA